MDYAKEVLRGIYLVDTDHFAREGHGAAYIVRGTVVAVVETGFSYSAERVLRALQELGVPPEDVGYIMVTHIHLDHAGGAGPLSEACQGATVVAHERGAKHLIKPSYLIKSVKEATGPMFPRYGEAVPIPASRVLAAGGGELISLGGGFKLEAIATPGHAPHHLCFFEHRTGALFTGDAAGIYWPEMERLLPTTPPPSFDLEQSLESLSHLRELGARTLLYTHFGPHGEPAAMLHRYAELLQDWVGEVRDLKRKLEEDEAVKERLVERYLPVFEGYYEQEIIAHEIRMNAQGVLRYLGRCGGMG